MENKIKNPESTIYLSFIYDHREVNLIKHILENHSVHYVEGTKNGFSGLFIMTDEHTFEFITNNDIIKFVSDMTINVIHDVPFEEPIVQC